MINWLQLEQVLRLSDKSDFAATEGIRRIAIREEVSGVSWERVGALYYVGLAYGKCNADFFRSMSISALECLQEISAPRAMHLAAHSDAVWALEQLMLHESSVTSDTLYLKASINYWAIIRKIISTDKIDHDLLLYPISTYRAALEIDATHWLSRYFLICCLFDRKDWSNCLTEIRTLLGQNNQLMSQRWRRAKLEEWHIVCLFKTGVPAKAQYFLSKFLDQYALDTAASLDGVIESLDEIDQCLQVHVIRNSLKERFDAFKSALEYSGII